MTIMIEPKEIAELVKILFHHELAEKRNEIDKLGVFSEEWFKHFQECFLITQEWLRHLDRKISGQANQTSSSA